MQTKAFFQNIKSELLNEIQGATNQIIVAVAWFTDKKIFNSLLEKAKSGIEVQLMIADDDINRAFGPDYTLLQEVGGTLVKVSTASSEKLMHNKFCIIDKQTVITGSYNWSKKAIDNHENITITWGNPILAQQFIQEFEALKMRYSQAIPAGKIYFDYVKVSQRLQMIKSLILLSEFQELELQIEKLNQFELIDEVEEIIFFIRQSFYSDALLAIEKLSEKYTALISVDGDKMASLKLELIYLEIELSSLQVQHDTLERSISDFRYKVRMVLGKFILQLLDLKIEWNKIREKLGKAFEYESLKNDFAKFEDELNFAKENPKTELTDNQEKEIKELYRRGVQLCHPDKVQEPYKAKAQEVFIRLKLALDQNDYKEVKRIVDSLEAGIWELGPDLANGKEVQKLELLVQDLRLKVTELKIQMDKLAASEDYQELQKFDNLEKYLVDQEVVLKQEILIYQSKIKQHQDGQ